jgi:hypothetical protein
LPLSFLRKKNDYASNLCVLIQPSEIKPFFFSVIPYLSKAAAAALPIEHNVLENSSFPFPARA